MQQTNKRHSSGKSVNENDKKKNNVMKATGLLFDHLIGKGAFASVYLCRKQFSRKKFAAKVIDYSNEIQIKWETENEIDILEDLSHCRHIVRMNGTIREGRTITCLLEYIPGPTFINGILNWPRFNENDVKTVMKQLLKALSFCHSKRIIHRDISPENLMWSEVPSLKKPSAVPLLKLIDFNIARRVPDGVPFISADPLGNQSYMAPETLHEEPVASFKTDIWSAGVVMFLILGGYPPFWNDNYNHLIANITEANYVLPDHLWRHASISGMDILTKALLKKHEQRPTADELLSYKWFHHNNEQTHILPSTKRLHSFLENIKKEREKSTHRRYTLTPVKRVAYIPTESEIGSESKSEKLSNTVLNKKNANINFNRRHSNRSSIKVLVIKYERLSLDASVS